METKPVKYIVPKVGAVLQLKSGGQGITFREWKKGEMVVDWFEFHTHGSIYHQGKFPAAMLKPFGVWDFDYQLVPSLPEPEPVTEPKRFANNVYSPATRLWPWGVRVKR